MAQRYKVFINDKEIRFFLDEKKVGSNEIEICFEFADVKGLVKILDDFVRSEKSCMYLTHLQGEEESFSAFCRNFQLIKAGGGIVKNTKGEILLINRRGIWDLPKGKMEDDESPEETSVREVTEETGIGDIKIVSEPDFSWHMYKIRDQWVLKKTWWYLMETFSQEMPVPQQEEEIEEAGFYPLDQADLRMKTSFHSLQELWERIF